MTTLNHLRKLIENDGIGCQVGRWDGHCNFCGIDPRRENHDPDCPWAAAKAHVKEKDRLLAIRRRLGAARCRDAESSDRPRGMIDNKAGEMTMVEEFCSAPEGKAEFDREKAKLVAEIEKRNTNQTRIQNDHP